MVVAPGPVVPLKSDLLVVVLATVSMLTNKVIPVGVIFAVAPVMVVAAVPILDPNLHAHLRCGSAHQSQSRRNLRRTKVHCLKNYQAAKGRR
jgi:hypothetical protein